MKKVSLKINSKINILVVLLGFILIISCIFILTRQTTTGTQFLYFNDGLNYTYDLTKVKFDYNGMSLIGQQSTSQNVEVIMLEDIQLPADSKVIKFKEHKNPGTESQIFYQLTSDLKAWYYWNGTAWKTVGNCKDCYNKATDIDPQI